MGETYYYLYYVPDDIYPVVNWEFDNPATALEDLCEENGFVIGLGSDAANSVVIAPYNYERQLPFFPREEQLSGISQDILPAKIYVVGNRTVLQRTFYNLVAVGLEKDGTLKRITDLSYAPASWATEVSQLFENISDKEEKALAIKCVYKWYSIDWTVYDADEILPLLSELSNTVKIEGTTEHEKPYIISQKTNWDGISFTTTAKGRIDKGYTIDRKLGIVKFSSIVDIPGANSFSSGGFYPPSIDLVAAFEKKVNQLSDFIFYTLDITGGTELPAVHKVNNLVAYWIRNESSGSYVLQNEVELNDYIRKLSPQIYNKYSVRYPAVNTYPKIIRESAWGSFNAITWRADPDTGASTEIQKYVEIPRFAMPSYADKREKKQLKALWDAGKRLNKVRKIYPYD